MWTVLWTLMALEMLLLLDFYLSLLSISRYQNVFKLVIGQPESLFKILDVHFQENLSHHSHIKSQTRNPDHGPDRTNGGHRPADRVVEVQAPYLLTVHTSCICTVFGTV